MYLWCQSSCAINLIQYMHMYIMYVQLHSKLSSLVAMTALNKVELRVFSIALSRTIVSKSDLPSTTVLFSPHQKSFSMINWSPKSRSQVHNRQTRSSGALDIPLCRLSTGQRSFAFRGAKLWNSLNDNIKSLKCPRNFRRHLANVLLSWYIILLIYIL